MVMNGEVVDGRVGAGPVQASGEAEAESGAAKAAAAGSPEVVADQGAQRDDGAGADDGDDARGSDDGAGCSDDENLGMLERSLRALTARAVLGVPGMASQRPCAALAQELIEQEGTLEAAVTKCGDLGSRRWSDATARFVFGFVPFVGGMGVQLEEIWLQIRCVAIIAALYGHDVETESVQQKIILCLMDGAATQVADGSAKLQMERVALQQVLRKLVLSMSGASSLEGLFNGVMGTLRGAWSGGRPPPALIERCKTHFQPQSALRQPSTSTLWIGVMAASLVLCKLVTPVTKLIELPTKIVKPRERLDAMPWLGPMISIAAGVVAVGVVACAAKMIIARSRRTMSTIPLLVFLGLAGLQAVLAMNMAEDFLNAIVHRTNIVRVLYHVHRGLYGAIGLANHAQEIRTGTIPSEWKKTKTCLQISLLYWPWHALALGMPIPTHMIVVDIIALLCQNMLMDTLKRFEVLTSVVTRIFGTSQLMVAIENLLLRAGSVVANPQKVLAYLDDITPTQNECCFVVTMRDTAVFIGFAHAPIQMLLTSKMLSDGQKGMLVLTELSAIGMALSIRMQFIKDEIQEDLTGRCRLFTIIPADTHGKEKMKRAVDWVAKFERTVTPIRNVTSSITKATTDSLSQIRQSVSSVAQSVAATDTVAGVYNTLDSLQSSVSQRALEAEKARMEAIMQEALKEEDGSFDAVDEATGGKSGVRAEASDSGSHVGWSSFASAMTRATGGKIVDDEDDDDWGVNSTDESCTPRETDTTASAESPSTPLGSDRDSHDHVQQVPDGDGNLSAVVKSQSDFEVEIEVSRDEASGSGDNEIQWSFQLDCTGQSVLRAPPAPLGVDIGFEVLYHADSGTHSQDKFATGQSSPSKLNVTRMFPYQRYPLSTAPSVGSLPALVSGTYVARWDNSYSWTTSKRIKYRVWVGPKVSPSEAEAEAGAEADPSTSRSELGTQQSGVTQTTSPLVQQGTSGDAVDDKVHSRIGEQSLLNVQEPRAGSDGDATSGKLGNPAAWLSGLVPGGPNDMTNAVANAATWARQRTIEAQKTEMKRKIEEALAEQALQDEEAAAELAARRQRELEELGVTSDADDVASRILRRRAAASRARASQKQQGTSVVQSSALRSTALVLPTTPVDDRAGATSAAANVQLSSDGETEKDPEHEPAAILSAEANLPEEDAKELGPDGEAEKDPEHEPAAILSAEANLPEEGAKELGPDGEAENDPEHEPAAILSAEANLPEEDAKELGPDSTNFSGAEVTDTLATGGEDDRRMLEATSSVQESEIGPELQLEPQLQPVAFEDDFGDAPDIDDDAFDVIPEARLAATPKPVQSSLTLGAEMASQNAESVDGQRESTDSNSSQTQVVATSCRNAAFDMNGEMIRRSKLTRKFTQLRDNLACHDPAPDGPQTTKTEIEQKPRLREKPELRSLDIETSPHKDRDGVAGASTGKSPPPNESPLAAKMRLLAAEIAAESKMQMQAEASQHEAIQVQELQQAKTALEEVQPESSQRAQAQDDEPSSAETAEPVADGPEKMPPTSDSGSSSSEPTTTSWLGNWMPGGANDVTSVVVSAATWAQQRDVDAQKAEMQRKIDLAIAAETKETERLAAEESARQAVELAAMGVSNSAETEGQDDFATRILKKRAAARARAAVVAARKQD